jgi:hypothetical protein
MAKNTPSTIDRLLPDLQELIARLRREGRTIDEIRGKLLELDVEVSRSALGRHVKSLAEVQIDMRRSRELAIALVGEFGEDQDDKLARANLEMMQSHIMRVMSSVVENEDGQLGLPVFSPKELMELSRSISAVAGAAKTQDDRIDKAVKRASEKATLVAADNATKAARAAGLSTDGVNAIRYAVLGA